MTNLPGVYSPENEGKPRPRTPGWTTYDRGDVPLLLVWGLAVSLYVVGRVALETINRKKIETIISEIENLQNEDVFDYSNIYEGIYLEEE